MKSTVCILTAFVGAFLVSGAPLTADDQPIGLKLFDKHNLVAWCIVPFDAKNRGPSERAEMLA